MSGIELIERLKAEGQPTAGHHDYRQWRRTDGGSGDEGGSRGFHREAGQATDELLASIERALDQTRDTRNTVCIAGRRLRHALPV